MQASNQQTAEAHGMWVMRHAQGMGMQVALDRAADGRQVALVSASSAYHCGGGFFSGGRHALEESLCVTTTLYKSLRVAEDLARKEGAACLPSYAKPKKQKDGSNWDFHIPEDGAVLSPFVEVFRGGTNEGYPFKTVPVKLAAILSVAMPNCNEKMKDAPIDRPPDDGKYMDLLITKFTAVMAAGIASGADCLVIPDLGCGVYLNKPEDVGKAMGTVMRGQEPPFLELHIVGSKEFAEAVAAAAASPPQVAATASTEGVSMKKKLHGFAKLWQKSP
jgi:uncharacterized protein (TIGR02452 family)